MNEELKVDTEVVVTDKSEQVIEVEYDQAMIDEDLKIQASGVEEDLVQDNFNTDGVEDILGEGAEIDELFKID